jgi:hypothetical protein
MAEPVSVPPGVGIVRAPASAKPRRFISTSTDGRSGFWTVKSDEELTADAAAAKALHDARIAQSLQWHPSIAGQRQAEREAAQQQAFDERWPDPRAALRSAHAVLREAEMELLKLRQHATAAAEHTAQCEAEVKHSSAAVEVIRTVQAGRLRARLAGNDDTSPDDDDPAHAEVLSIVHRADRALSVALTAHAGIAVEVANAEDAVARAKARTVECARALCTQAAREGRVKLSELEQQADGLRQQLWPLESVRDRPRPAEWQPWLRKLLDDPEAPLIKDENKSAVEPATTEPV